MFTPAMKMGITARIAVNIVMMIGCATAAAAGAVRMPTAATAFQTIIALNAVTVRIPAHIAAAPAFAAKTI